MSDFYWPEAPGDYDVCDSRGQPERLTFDGRYWTKGGSENFLSSESLERSFHYLGVRREAEQPDNAATAQQALDEWRACKQQPKAADWAYKWAVTLCEIAGAS